MYSASKIRKPWGTITHPKERNPDYLLGHQKLSAKQVSDVINRLYQDDWHQKREKMRASIRNENARRHYKTKTRTAAEVEDIVQRLTRNSEKNVTDSNRTGAMKEMGIYNTYACKGWNWTEILLSQTSVLYQGRVDGRFRAMGIGCDWLKIIIIIIKYNNYINN